MEQDHQSSGSFISELKRRRVIRTCLLYILLCWGGLQVGDIVFPAIGIDGDIGSRYLLYAAILGFPLTFALAWFFQIGPHGVVLTHSFVERRVLTNIPPLNERRHAVVSDYFRKGEDHHQFNWILSAETGPLNGMSFGLEKTLLVGRSLDCDIAVVSPHVSRQHARLTVEEGQLMIEDLDSSNGTMVNGKLVKEPQALHHEDELRFHDIIFRVTESFARGKDEMQSMNHTTFIRPVESIPDEDAPEGKT